MASSTLDVGVQRPTSPGGKTFLGHPRGLATLFMTEMWERFSFYGMRALLVLYLVAGTSEGGLGYTAAVGAAIYSVYNAMLYLLALPGGWLADRFWGARRTVAVGGGIIMVGHFLLAVPSTASFFAGLALIAVGSGLLKANISTMVGHLYDGPNDPRRDGGFTIFYMGINLGAFLAPLVIGTVGQNIGWHFGFALAEGRHGHRPGPVPAGHPPPERPQRRGGLADHARREDRRVPQGGALGGPGRGVLRRRHAVRPDVGRLGDLAAVDRGHRRPGALLRPDQAGQGPRRGRAVQDEGLHLVLRGRRRVLDDLRPVRLDAQHLRDRLDRLHAVRLRLPVQLVPVAQPALHHGAGPGLRLALGLALAPREEPQHHHEVRLRPAADRRVLPGHDAGHGRGHAAAPRSRRSGWRWST